MYSKQTRWYFVACLLALGMLLIGIGASANSTFYVANSGNDANAGTNSTFPKQHIQTAINTTVSGDTVVIADGIYTGTGNKDLDFGGRNITVRSASGNPTRTVIDCQGAGRGFYFHSGETSAANVSGLTIRNGSAYVGGGAIYNSSSSPTVTNCTFSGSSASVGGGMLNEASSPTVTNCVFNGNSADSGGGMFTDEGSPSVTYCTFTNNGVSSNGGGMTNYFSNARITNCTFSGNISESGGGMYNSDSSARITDCTFIGNIATFNGGGMYNYNTFTSYFTSLTIINCTFANNKAIGYSGSISYFGYGGGMFNSSWNGGPTISNSTFSGNSSRYGGGIYNYGSSPTVTNCTFTANTAIAGGGVDNSYGSYRGQVEWDSYPILTNCILWGDTGGEIYNDTYFSFSYATVTYSDVQGDYPGVGNLNTAPLFVRNPSAGNTGDLHLQADSRCIGAGSNDAVMMPLFPVDGAGNPLDLDGNPRILGERVDMGAYEASPGIMVTYGGFRYNRATGRFVQTVTLTNNVPAILGPISLVLDNLSANATLFNATGVTVTSLPAGSPYIDVLSEDMAAYSRVTVTLEFVNPTMQTITYSTRVLTGSDSR